MAWERGYYYRVRKRDGRVRREYFGKGEVAELVAQMDAVERERRELAALELRQEKEALAQVEAEMKAVEAQTVLVTRVALLAAGFHQHTRGEWRKRRG